MLRLFGWSWVEQRALLLRAMDNLSQLHYPGTLLTTSLVAVEGRGPPTPRVNESWEE